jgi:hypothetical protein
MPGLRGDPPGHLQQVSQFSTARCSRRRRVRLHDADACPIAKRRLGQLVEFGYKVQVTGNDDGIILGHDPEYEIRPMPHR